MTTIPHSCVASTIAPRSTCSDNPAARPQVFQNYKPWDPQSPTSLSPITQSSGSRHSVPGPPDYETTNLSKTQASKIQSSETASLSLRPPNSRATHDTESIQSLDLPKSRALATTHHPPICWETPHHLLLSHNLSHIHHLRLIQDPEARLVGRVWTKNWWTKLGTVVTPLVKRESSKKLECPWVQYWSRGYLEPFVSTPESHG